MPKYKVTKHHTLVIAYTTIVDAPYPTWDTPEQERAGDSAQCVADRIAMKHWDTNHEIIEEEFEFVDAEEITTKEWKADNDFAKSVCQMPD
jgi:hypothetical protein